jgi:aminopeptidase N
VDGDKILLVEKKESKTLDNYLAQYKYAGNYMDRREAIDYCAQKQDDPKALELLKTALKDQYFGLRSYTIGKLNMALPSTSKAVEPILAELAAKDPKTLVKAKAIEKLADYKKPEYKNLFIAALKDSSYSVAGAGLEALTAIDPQEGATRASAMLTQKTGGKLAESLTKVLISQGDENNFEFIAKNFESLPFGQAKFEALQPLAEYLAKVKDTQKVKRGVDLIADFRDKIPEAYQSQTTPFINNLILKGLATKKTSAGDDASKQQAEYINSKMSGKKAF